MVSSRLATNPRSGTPRSGYRGSDLVLWHTFTVDGSAASRPFLEGKAEVRGARSPLLSKSVGPQSSSSARLERNFLRLEPADLPGGHPEMGAFGVRRLSAHPLVRATSADMLVFSFAKRANAEKFREWFGGKTH